VGPRIRHLAPGELPAALRSLSLAFGSELVEPAEWGAVVEPDRTLVADDDGAIVGTAGAFSLSLSIPGAALPTAGITIVSVQATHRRRGLLRRFVAELLEDAGRRREPLAALWASEASIYGRFGFGVASRAAVVSVSRAHAALLPAPGPLARARLVPLEDAPAALADVYEGLRHIRGGVPSRTAEWWRVHRLRDDPARRDGAGPLTCAVVEAPGEPAAYALYRVRPRWEHGLPAGTLEVAEAVSLTAGSSRALWEFLLGVDLVATVEAEMPVDGPLPHLLVDARRAVTEVQDQLWLRLLDVPAALGARTYPVDGSVVLDVVDELVPANARSWRLEVRNGTATVHPADGAPDLVMGIAALSSAYLGGVSLSELADAGLVAEAAPGAAARATPLFRTDRAPWCPEIF
jgi:predicted acetyltransferase